jgi:DNA-binding response OmpR family regulator
MNTGFSQQRSNSPPTNLPHPFRVNPGEANARTNESVTTILSVSPLVEDHAYLRRAGEKARWETREAYSRREAIVAIAAEHPDVILCEANLPDGDWKDLLEDLFHRLNPPPLIVTSRLADEYLWAEALNLGAYDVLVKPFDAEEVHRVVGFACQGSNASRNRAAAH